MKRPPPESPWHVSTPPCGYPAQSIVAGKKPPPRASIWASHVTSSTIGTAASSRMSELGPPEAVTPQPTMPASMPATMSAASSGPGEPDALHARRSGGRQAQERPVVRQVAALRLVGPPVHEVDLAHHLHRHEPEVVHADLGLDADPGQEVPVVVGDAVGGREQPAVADQRRPAGAVGQAGDEDVDMRGPGPFAGSRRASPDDRGAIAYGREAGRPDRGRVHSRGLPSHPPGGGGTAEAETASQERDARGDDRNEPPRCAGNHPARLRAGRSQCQAERFATMRR